VKVGFEARAGQSLLTFQLKIKIDRERFTDLDKLNSVMVVWFLVHAIFIAAPVASLYVVCYKRAQNQLENNHHDLLCLNP